MHGKVAIRAGLRKCNQMKPNVTLSQPNVILLLSRKICPRMGLPNVPWRSRGGCFIARATPPPTRRLAAAIADDREGYRCGDADADRRQHAWEGDVSPED